MTDARSQAQSCRPKAMLRRLLRDDAAASAVFFAITLSSTVGMVGLGTEAGMWFAEKRQYQTAADAGAIAGALSIVSQLNADNTVTPTFDDSPTGPAWTEAVRNGAETYVPNSSVRMSTGSGAYVVQVLVSEPKNTMLAAVSSSLLTSVTINAAAEATVAKLGSPCINGLSNPGTAIEVQGSAKVTSPNCVVVSNSASKGTSPGAKDPPSVEVQGGNNAVLAVAGIYTPGSVLASGNPDMNAPLSGTAPSTGADNPFELAPAPPTTIPSVTATAASGCTGNLSASGGTPQAGTLCRTNGQQNTQGNVSLSGHAWTLSNGNDVGGNLTIGTTSATSSITTFSGHTYNITGSFSTSGAGTTATLAGEHRIGGDFTIDSNATLNGTYYVAGNLLIKSGTVTINGTAYVKGSITISGGTVAIANDIYGNDFDITGGTVTLNGTAFVINSGSGSNIGFSVGSGASISTPTDGHGSTIVLSGANAYFDINSNSTVNLTAPRIDSGSAYAGLVFYQDPTSTHTSSIDASKSTLLGAIYAKSAEVDFAGNSNSACTIIIAKVISFTGNSGLDTTACAGFVNLPTFYKVSLTL